jgi:hypothetical protein
LDDVDELHPVAWKTMCGMSLCRGCKFSQNTSDLGLATVTHPILFSSYQCQQTGHDQKQQQQDKNNSSSRGRGAADSSEKRDERHFIILKAFSDWILDLDGDFIFFKTCWQLATAVAQLVSLFALQSTHVDCSCAVLLIFL